MIAQTRAWRLAYKRRTDKWPKHPDAVPIPDPPDPPEIDTRLCPHCDVKLRKNQDDKRGTRSFMMECPLCGCNPY